MALIALVVNELWKRLEMQDFQPAEDYLNLKKQAQALHRLCKTQESELSIFRKMYYDLLNEIKLQRMEEVNSLREENSQLTNLLEEYESSNRRK